ncbi:hypothetical protein [Paenibacillus wenxiniae]|uniref:Glycosyltransferase RgtA/B/C/D-like domain-containing protein n=1 Tax=Paenibacillus wenxiniae TaxID=1636843 RepID=A0ABW4RHD8_9BACL
MKKNFFFVSVFSIYFYIFYSQMYRTEDGFFSDLPAHMDMAMQFFEGKGYLAHPGFYFLAKLLEIITPLDFKQASVCMLSIFATAIAYIIFKVIEKETEYAFEYTGMLMLVTAIFIPFFNHLYLGQASSNIYHNPTLIIVKPFAYLSLILFIRLLDQMNKKMFWWATIVLTLSVIMKPNFILAFLFTIPIYLLLKKANLKQWLLSAGMIVPTLFILAYQYVRTYNTETASSVVIDPFGVWNLWTPSPLFSFLLGTAFPLAIVIFRYRQVWNSKFLLCSWIGLVISYSQFILLAEGGYRFSHGNFAWGLQIFIALVFLFSVIEWIHWKKETFVGWKMSLVNIIFSLHLVSGSYYLIRIMLGYSIY